MKLYRHALSGHAHRVELFLSLLGRPVELIDVDLQTGAHKAADFLAKNAFAQVPVLEDGHITLSDSNAILVYLAKAYGGPDWLPEDAAVAAEVQRFLSVAAGELARGPAAARLATVFAAPLDQAQAIASAEALFTVLDGLLQKRRWIAGTASATIADIALYSYVAHAPEGGVSLAPYAALTGWLARIEALEGFVPMQASAAGLLAA